MKKTFTISDIELLREAFESSSIKFDKVPAFLAQYELDRYETEDDSIMFDADGKNMINIEFFNFEHPLMRTCSVMFFEAGKCYTRNF